MKEEDISIWRPVHPIQMYTPFNYIDMLMQLADTLLSRHAYWKHLFILTKGRSHLK